MFALFGWFIGLGGGLVMSAVQCSHGYWFGLTDSVSDECQTCDWCDHCEAVREWAGETCTGCGAVWGHGEGCSGCYDDAGPCCLGAAFGALDHDPGCVEAGR